MSSKRPAKLGMAKKKSPTDKYLAWAKKNTAGLAVCAGILFCTLFILFSGGKSEQLAKQEENMYKTIGETNKMGDRFRSDLKGYTAATPARQASAALWASFTPWERKHTITLVETDLKEDLKKNVAFVLNAPNLVAMFKTSSPDVYSDEFAESPDQLFTLLDAYVASKDTTLAVLGADLHEAYGEVSNNNFWGGMSDFSDYDRKMISAGGWGAARASILGRFFKVMNSHMAANVEKKANGEELEFPEEPEPEPEWKDEEGAQDVAHLEDDTFDTRVGAKTHALVMFYAPWCGHCKKMKPDYGQVATLLSEGGFDVTIGAVDAVHKKSKKIRKRFEVDGFPTLFYMKDGVEVGKYDGERDLYGILSYLNDSERLGSPELAALAESHKPEPVLGWKDEENDVTHLEDETFDETLSSAKHALVMFYAPWCGHCKAFKPAFGEAATHFKDDADISIAGLDVTLHRKSGEQFDVKGFPTTLYFENGVMVEKYEGARDLDGVVSYMAAKKAKAEL